jgi:glycyl-tRNA synthetase beta chain
MDYLPLLIEIGVEEFPAEPLLREIQNIPQKWESILSENGFKAEFSLFYTPRRLTLWHREFPIQQETIIKEFFGAPINVAYQNGEPTKAFYSFSQKCGVEPHQISKKVQNNKEVLYFRQEESGKNLVDLLENMLNKFLISLNFGKSMRWRNGEFNFIRPIHSIVAMLDDKNIPLKVFGINSKSETFGHRNFVEKIILTHTGDYFCNLPKNGVIVKQNERRLIILEGFKRLELEHNFKIEINNELLDEVVALTEDPRPLLGTFESRFLEIPSAVIVISMREHQRYFPVYRDGKLLNNFIVVSNAITDDYSGVIRGNERVLRARLSDALFFYENDLKRGLNGDRLANIIFVDGLGTVADKVQRERKIGEILAGIYNCKACFNYNIIDRAIFLAKNDLLTEMVGEFTELQGVIGGYYAKKLGENELIATAIKEQYLPAGENDSLPSNLISSIVSMSYKLDLIFGLFSIGHLPTGSRDPFGLRRAVNGIIRIVHAQKLAFDFDEVAKILVPLYLGFNIAKLREFFFERVLNFYSKDNSSIIKSVLIVESELLKIDEKLSAIREFVNREDFDSQLSTFKRVSNILKDNQIALMNMPNINLYIDIAEKELHERFLETVHGNYREKLDALFQLKPQLDKFFERVMVNVPEIEIRENRKNLMALIYREFLNISDIREISIR